MPAVVVQSQVAKVAEVMQRCQKRAHAAKMFERIASTLKCSWKRAVKLARSTAHCCAQSQATTFRAVLGYVRALQASDVVQGLQCVLRVSHDETPLRLKVSFSEQSGGGDSNVETSKLFLVESDWTILLRCQPFENPRYVMLHGVYSPALRCSDSTAATGIAAVLRAVAEQQWPAKEDIEDVFQCTTRVCEADDAGANRRAERLWSSYRPGAQTMSFTCMAHKLHNVCERTWSLSPEVLSGIVRTLLCIQSSSHMERLRTALKREVPRRLLIVEDGVISRDAEIYRGNVLNLWCHDLLPCRTQSVILTLAGTMLNGDWRQPKTLIHICRGCCGNKQEAMDKCSSLMSKLLRTLRPRRLEKGNWASWWAPLTFIGLFTSLHNLLPDLFDIAFKNMKDRNITQQPKLERLLEVGLGLWGWVF